MSFIAWLKKHVCEDDAWITVHPNASGPGSPVLLDDEGYIKGGMGGKFTGQRIDLMPRKEIRRPASSATVVEQIKRYNLRNSTKREMLQSVFPRLSPDASKELAISLYDAPDDLIYAFGQNNKNLRFSVGKGRDKDAAYAANDHVVIGENHRKSRDAAALSERTSAPEFRTVNDADATWRHEYGHALDYAMTGTFLGENTERGVRAYASSNSKVFSDGVKNTEKSLYTRVNGEKVLKDEILSAFGIHKSEWSDEYLPTGRAGGAVLSKCSPMSDILSALTAGKARGYWSHSASYWKSGGRENRRTEIFANLTNMYGAKDKTAWNECERLFPELCTAYKNVLARAQEENRSE